MTLTLFVLDHLLAFAIATSLILVAVLAYGVGLARGRGIYKSWPLGPPRIRLDWAGSLPIAIVESDPTTAADVAAWLDAVKEGAVLRV